MEQTCRRWALDGGRLHVERASENKAQAVTRATLTRQWDSKVAASAQSRRGGLLSRRPPPKLRNVLDTIVGSIPNRQQIAARHDVTPC